jgi:hypothetical protein
MGFGMIKGLNPRVIGAYGAWLYSYGATNTAQFLNRTLTMATELTWLVWVKVASVDTNPTRVINYNANTRLVLIPGGNSTAPFTVKGSVDTATVDATSTSTTTATCGAWHLISMTYSDTGDRKVRLYIDGAEVAYSAQTAGTGSIIGLTALRVGVSEATNAGYLTGIIGELAMHSVVRNAGEINTYYRGGITTNEISSQLHCGTVDSFLTDMSGNANDLTANGTITYTTERFKSQG